MVAVILSWIIISFVTLSFGDMLISLYNKICKKNDCYNIPETFMLGICFLLIPLSFLSLWFPSNHYTLCLFIFISSVYWILNTRRLKNRIAKIVDSFSTLTFSRKLIFIIASCCVLLYTLYSICWDDAIFYHYQQIEWNEHFSVVPGLANIEDRFAFNSNYLLIAAIFTFKFLFGESLYAIQSILFIYVMIWVLKEVITSKYIISSLYLLFFFLFFTSLNAGFLTDSSTDIIPNICTFYLITKFALYPKLSGKELFFFIMPIALCTFKMTIFPLCLVSLYIFYLLIKNKNKQQLFFLLTVPFCITSLWLIRNVIISGYLVYPLHELDLFSFEWKLPAGISLIQREMAISQFAKGLFKDYITFYFFERSGFLTFKYFLINHIIAVTCYLIIACSPIYMTTKFIKQRINKETLNYSFYIFYVSLALCFLYWLLSAPDIRFASGVICGSAFFIIKNSFCGYNQESPRLKYTVLYAVIIIISMITINRSIRYNKKISEAYLSGAPFQIKDLLTRPYSSMNQYALFNPKYSEYKSDELTIYLTNDLDYKGKFPWTKDISPEIIMPYSKLQNIKTVEFRGTSLQDGFKTKQEYITVIDSMAIDLLKKNKIEWW